MKWVLEVRPYLNGSVRQYSDGSLGLPVDVVLVQGDHGMSIVHQVIDALRQEARRRALLNPVAKWAPPLVPRKEVLMLPGAGRFADAIVTGGPAKGKTPLCLLANQ